MLQNDALVRMIKDGCFVVTSKPNHKFSASSYFDQASYDDQVTAKTSISASVSGHYLWVSAKASYLRKESSSSQVKSESSVTRISKYYEMQTATMRNECLQACTGSVRERCLDNYVKPESKAYWDKLKANPSNRTYAKDFSNMLGLAFPASFVFGESREIHMTAIQRKDSVVDTKALSNAADLAVEVNVPAGGGGSMNVALQQSFEKSTSSSKMQMDISGDDMVTGEKCYGAFNDGGNKSNAKDPLAPCRDEYNQNLYHWQPPLRVTEYISTVRAFNGRTPNSAVEEQAAEAIYDVMTPCINLDDEREEPLYYIGSRSTGPGATERFLQCTKQAHGENACSWGKEIRTLFETRRLSNGYHSLVAYDLHNGLEYIGVVHPVWGNGVDAYTTIDDDSEKQSSWELHYFHQYGGMSLLCTHEFDDTFCYTSFDSGLHRESESWDIYSYQTRAHGFRRQYNHNSYELCTPQS
mmetsp:Transcript_32710/g.52178  ORF Transcript_32710/g.52178 Transcript_32710/m.52178 type:complete len:468 (+) Transcript_32710:360-1763(+)